MLVSKSYQHSYQQFVGLATNPPEQCRTIPHRGKRHFRIFFEQSRTTANVALAEAVRFELTNSLTRRQFSRLVPSTTRPRFLQTSIIHNSPVHGRGIALTPCPNWIRSSDSSWWNAAFGPFHPTPVSMSPPTDFKQAPANHRAGPVRTRRPTAAARSSTPALHRTQHPTKTPSAPSSPRPPQSPGAQASGRC